MATFELPKAFESERIVLGSVIIGGRDAMKKIAHILTYKDFYENNHRLIFRSMEALYKKQQDIDTVTIVDVIKRQGYLDEVGGAAGVVDITNDVAVAAHIVTHARIVSERAVLRRMIQASQDIIRMAQEEGDLDEMLKRAEDKLKGVSRTSARAEDRLTTVDLEQWREIARNQEMEAGVVRGLSTGLKGLDDMLEGFEPGEMVILTGHTKHGKSRLAANVAVNVAAQGKTVLFVNTEMTKMQTARRVNQILGDDTVTGKIIVNDSAGLQHRDVISMMERAKERGCDLVIVDHLHFFNRSVDNATNEISVITKEFKDAAVEFELPLLMLAHVSQGDTKKVPTVQMLKNSSSIAQDADVVLTVWMDDKPSGDNSFTDVVRLAHRSANRSIRKITLYNNGMRLSETDERDGAERTRQKEAAENTARLLGERDTDEDLSVLEIPWD